jgi:hypothetical protein
MNCAEDTTIVTGLKRWNKVKGRKPLDEEIEDDRLVRKMDFG